MRSGWIACVPNLSEGWDAGTVRELARAALRAGAAPLDVHLDPDHNRSVLSLAGPPDLLVGAAFAVVRRAVELLDLRTHRGAHPRIGVADVVPFAPLEGAGEEPCVRAARALADRVARELGIPVYLYGWAAERAEHRELPDVRRAHRDALLVGGALSPDRGPDRPHPTAGAVAVGARPPLVAFNVYLDRPDTEAARRIARRVRERDGGLRGVRALGLSLDGSGRTQLSMNIVDIDETPPHAAVERAAELAAEEGTALAEGELVGLIPLGAVLRAAAGALRLPELRAEQVTELALMRRQQMEGTMDDAASLDGFLVALASAEPTPGGGAASALSGALAAALGSMVCNLTIGKPTYADAEPELRAVLAELERGRVALRRLMDDDAAVYRALMSAYRLPKATGEERASRRLEIDAALVRAADVPLEAARACVAVLRALEPVARAGNSNAISDAGAAAALAEAGTRASLLNVRINAGLMRDGELAGRYRAEMEAVEREAVERGRAVLEVAVARIGR